MSNSINAEMLTQIEQYDIEKRFKYLLTEVTKHNELWLLTDKHGCMMLNSDEEDCVPVWPNKEFAQTWATGDWQDCQPQAINLKQWHSRWTTGLADDELAVVVFPDKNEQGLVLTPDEFDFELKKQVKKLQRHNT